MSAAASPQRLYSGTSLTKDTLLEQQWNRSSQGVWHIPCGHCGFENIAALEPDGHLISMLGPIRDDVSEARPGVVCHRCSKPSNPKPINPRHGHWVHRRPELRKSFVGYHIPQILMPGHYASRVKWTELIGKMNGVYSTGKFYNEVLGEPYDVAVKLVGEDDLRKAAAGVGPNTEAAAVRRAPMYAQVVLGVDWGGGGEDGVSRTKCAAIGLRADGIAEVFYGAQFPPSTDRVAEGRAILKIAGFCRAKLIAHDYVGDGRTSESVLTHLGWPVNALAPMVYRQNLGGDILTFQKPVGNRTRPFYTLDKTESLRFVCLAIRALKVRFFDFDKIDGDRPGLVCDFLALAVEQVETPTGEVYRIRRSTMAGSDDFAMACNYGLCAMWEQTRSWPNVASAGTIF